MILLPPPGRHIPCHDNSTGGGREGGCLFRAGQRAKEALAVWGPKEVPAIWQAKEAPAARGAKEVPAVWEAKEAPAARGTKEHWRALWRSGAGWWKSFGRIFMGLGICIKAGWDQRRLRRWRKTGQDQRSLRRAGLGTCGPVWAKQGNSSPLWAWFGNRSPLWVWFRKGSPL